jgi:corrinoid protein of di/trimethylamine methyltransferase
MTDLNTLFDAIVNGNHELSVATTRSAIEEGIDPQRIIAGYMIPAMDKIGKMFEDCDVFIPELLMAARAMKGSLQLLQPLLTTSGAESKGRVLIGTVQGDLHDIGKNIVGSMLEGAGFQVINLGNDVTPQKFVDGIKNHNPQIVAMSALLTTTMTSMETTIKAIQDAGLRDKVKIMIGGAPVSKLFSEKIGADGYSDNANGAVKLARTLVC